MSTTSDLFTISRERLLADADRIGDHLAEIAEHADRRGTGATRESMIHCALALVLAVQAEMLTHSITMHSDLRWEFSDGMLWPQDELPALQDAARILAQWIVDREAAATE